MHGKKNLLHVDGLVQQRHNSIALALELRLSCINPSMYYFLFLLKRMNKVMNTLKYFCGILKALFRGSGVSQYVLPSLSRVTLQISLWKSALFYQGITDEKRDKHCRFLSLLHCWKRDKHNVGCISILYALLALSMIPVLNFERMKVYTKTNLYEFPNITIRCFIY